MIVFIPAAGLGTRLKPLTDSKPKALVEYHGKPLLQHLLERLQAQGFCHFVLNLHHFAPMLRDFAAQYAASQNIRIDFSDESACLLDTGGALTHALAAGLFGEAGYKQQVLVHNVDIFSDLDLHLFQREFENRHADALLSVRRRETSRYLYAAQDGRLRAWKNLKTGDTKGETIRPEFAPYAFSGIHLLHTDLIREWAAQYGTDRPFSVIDAYLDSAVGHNIFLQEQTSGLWKDMGKIEDFE